MPTAVPIDPAKLIEAARDFADHHIGVGRPRPVWLRRAVSSAYYALFHHVGLEAAAHLLGRSSRTDQLDFARTFGHQPVKNVCEWIAGRAGAPTRAKPLAQSLQNTPIDDMANTFIDLQEQRHLADYDHLTPFPKATVLGAIQDAEVAMQKLDRASAQERETFFTLISMKTGLR